MKKLHVDCRHRIETLKEATAKSLQSQSTKDWTVTEEEFDGLQLLLIATFPAVV